MLFAVSYNYGADLAGIRFRPGAPHLGSSAALGALVIPSVGWYSADAGEPSNDYTRNGGHVVSLSRARPGTGAESPYVLYFNDPANGGYDTTQSAFVGQPYGVESPTLAIMNGQQNLISKVAGYGSGWLEGLLTIQPKFALLPDPVTLGGFKLVKALTLFEKGEDDKVIDLGVVGDVLDYQIAPTSAEHPHLLTDGTLLMVNAVDGSSRKLGRYDGARRLAYDDQWRLHLLMGDGSVRSFGPDDRTVGRGKLPVPADELVYNPALKKFLALDQDEGVLHVLSPEFRAETRILLPAVAGAKGRVSLNVNRRTGQIGVLAEGSRVLHRIDRVGREYNLKPLELPTGDVLPLSAFADDSGAWYVVGDDKRVHVFDGDGKPVEGNPFAGLESGPLFRIVQSEAIGDDLGGHMLPDSAPRPDRELRLAGPNVADVGQTPGFEIRLLASSEPGTAGRPLRWQRTGAHPGEGALRTDRVGRARLAWRGGEVGHDDLFVWEDGNGDGKRQFEEASAFIGVDWIPPKGGILKWSPNAYSVNEAAGTVTLSVSRSGGSLGAASVQVLSQNATAKAPADYGAVSTTLSWASGDTSPKSVTMSIANDGMDEYNEGFRVRLLNPSGAALGTLAEQYAAVLIGDDDAAPSVSWRTARLSNVEGTSNVLVTARLSAPSGKTVTAPVAISGTATPGVDHDASFTSVTFNPGTTVATHGVNLLNDDVHELTESARFTLAAPADGSAVVGAPALLNLVITDDD
ncbi:MAG TPA: Calx-beta domain-containing protein [Nevskiaceae bacterium]|nr:Calx-beta domain-containing protein [Nevskiaceae bacterium]